LETWGGDRVVTNYERAQRLFRGFEEDYNESEAKAAYEGAERVFRLGQELRVELKGGRM
jgi:hypothetical protein